MSKPDSEDVIFKISINNSGDHELDNDDSRALCGEVRVLCVCVSGDSTEGLDCLLLPFTSLIPGVIFRDAHMEQIGLGVLDYHVRRVLMNYRSHHNRLL